MRNFKIDYFWPRKFDLVSIAKMKFNLKKRTYIDLMIVKLRPEYHIIIHLLLLVSHRSLLLVEASGSTSNSRWSLLLVLILGLICHIITSKE
jgi:hypothetical protein